MHYYNFNIGDYHSHTSHLSEMEDLAYRRMIDWCCLHESGLPKNIDMIARLIRMRTHTDCIAIVLDEFFDETESGYEQPRIMEDITKYQDKSEKAKKSANARWNKKSSDKPVKSNANALQPQSESNANQQPTTNNHKPINNDDFDRSRAFDDFWKVYPRKIGKGSAKKKFMICCKSVNTFLAIMHGLESYLPEWKKTEKKFIPHASTWLNGERWTDDIETVFIEAKETGFNTLTDSQLVEECAKHGISTIGVNDRSVLISKLIQFKDGQK